MKNIIRKTNKSILLLLVLAFILTACQLHKFTPQEVIKNTLQSDDRVAYYGELNITMIENDYEEIMSMKEWRDSELGRVELVTKEEHVVSIINDETVLSYSDQEKKAYLVNGQKESELFVHPREGLNTMLKNLHDTHDIKMSGDSKIANRKVFHMIAKDKNRQDSMDIEFWVDKQHSIILKLNLVSEEFQFTVTYETIKFNPKFDSTLFHLEAPENYDIETLDHNDIEKEITIEEMIDLLGSDAFYFPDDDEHRISGLTQLNLPFEEDEEPIKQVTIQYTNGVLPSMLLSITSFLTDSNSESNMSELMDDNDRIVDLGPFEAQYNEKLQLVTWEQGNYFYMLELVDSEVTIEEIRKWIEKAEN